MKKLLPFVFSIVAATALAQAPEAFSYQAVARDAGGDPLANTTVGVQFQLHQTTAVGMVVYAETHSPTTNELGLFSVEVGNGTPTTGTFSAIDWSAGPYFLEVGLDPAGGSSYTSVGTQQLLSVPYALHARTADLAEDGDWVVNGATMHNDGKQVGIGTAAPVRRLQVEDLLNGATIRPAVKVKTHNCGVPCGQPETTQALSLQNENSTWGNVVGIGFSDNDADETPSAWIGARLTDKAQHHGDLLFHTRDESGLHQRMMIERTGHVGIGTTAPDTTLHVAGGFKYQDGTQADKRILTSDADGNASWQVPDGSVLLDGFSPPFNLDCLAASATRPTGSTPRAVAQYGQYLYVANYIGNSMQVFDVSDPGIPTLVTSVPTILPVSITISGGRAFVVNQDQNLSVFDLGTPASPALLGSVPTDLQPTSVAVNGDYAYVSHGSGAKLMVYDVSDPSSMSHLNSLGCAIVPGSTVAIKDDHLYWVANTFSRVFDLSIPTIPQNVVTTTSWGGDHFTRSGDHLYVASTLTDELIVVDVSNAAQPVVVATVPAGSDPKSVAVAGNNAFLVSYSSNELIVFDVSDPASPLPRGSAATGQPWYVTSDGEHAYVVSLNQDLLTAFQVFCSQGLAVDLGSGQVVFEDPIWEKNGPHISSTNSGNVGIGTTTPGFRLTTKYDTGLGNTVPNSGTTDAQCGFRLTSGIVGLDMGVLQNGTSYLQNRNINNFATSYGLVLNPTGGNVGIGTTSPSAKLEVAGTVKATNVLANNILSVAALHAGLTNAGAYTGSSTTNEWALEWGSIYQNTNPAVFNLTSGGQIVSILKDGVIEVDAQFDFVRNTSGYTRIRIKVNGTDLTQSLATSNGDWQQVHAHLTWQVQAGDQVMVTAIRNEIDQMDNGTWSTLSIKWTGVND